MKAILGAIWRNVGFICVAAVAVYCVVHAFDPPRLNWGDSGSDYNVMTAGRNFHTYGFFRLHLTPYLLDPGIMTAADRSMIYTHYPQLPDLMNGLERTVGLSDLVQFRFVALAFSFAALYFVYALLKIYWSRPTAQLALALWVLNPMWLQHADYLHHVPYAFFFGFGSVYFLARYLRDGARLRHLLLSSVFLFLVFLSSYDYWIFAPILLAIVTIAHYRAVNRAVVRVLGTLAAFAIAALAVKLGTNIWALGGGAQFLQDLHFQFIERATDKVAHIPFMDGAWPTLYGRVERCFSLLLFPIAAFWAIAPLVRRRLSAESQWLVAKQANPWLLLVAALPFLCLFPEIWIRQYYPTLLVLPFYAVACAALAVRMLEAPHRAAKGVGIALIVALLANSIDEDVSFKKAFFEKKDIQTLRAQLDSVSAPGQFILVNHMFDSEYHYYFDRNVVLLLLNPPESMDAALAYYTSSRRPRVAPPTGAIFVQNKHLADQLFDKGFYNILALQGAWSAWGNPERYRSAIDKVVTEQDSMLVAKVAAMADKLYETDSYAVWRFRPHR
jgi:hypothetical protein